MNVITSQRYKLLLRTAQSGVHIYPLTRQQPLRETPLTFNTLTFKARDALSVKRTKT